MRETIFAQTLKSTAIKKRLIAREFLFIKLSRIIALILGKYRYPKLAFLLLFALSGCSTYSNQFDCPYGKGLGCASLSRVNKMIDDKEITLDDDPSTENKRKILIYYGPHKMSRIVEIPELSNTEHP